MIAVTGANGKLGRLVVEGLLEHVPAGQIIAAVRSVEKASDLKALGVQVREADYTRPQTLPLALEGVEKLLLISAVEIGQRVVQHKAVIDAAKMAGVKLMAYTSLLRSDTSDLIIANEHKTTEEYLVASGLEFVIFAQWVVSGKPHWLAWTCTPAWSNYRQLRTGTIRISFSRRLRWCRCCGSYPSGAHKQNVRTCGRRLFLDV